MRGLLVGGFVGAAAALFGGGSALGGVGMGAAVEISRAEYPDRLRAFWLGQSIANWTGLRGEGVRNNPPFLTDSDWGTDAGRGLLEFVFQDPWGADDDTDIEYVYSLLVDEHGPMLTAEQIRDGWVEHINDFIWVSNAEARLLMDRGVTGRSLSLPVANRHWLKIDAQLTTEFFGAYAPGMPRVALELSELPIRTTAFSHAAHASQFFVVLHALAPVVPEGLSDRDRVLWLVDEARRWIPDTSKAADVVDFVRSGFVANPDVENWELTRDAIYDRYQLNAETNGFRYRAFTESSVNFATGVMALLYGEGDYKRTVQIATLSGWDSDNPASTMGGLLGLLGGMSMLEDAFPDEDFSDRYWSSRTRDAMPDYLPGDPEAEDTFTLLADRMMAGVDAAVEFGGGRVGPRGEWWLVPGLPVGDVGSLNPMNREWNASATNQVRRVGGWVSSSSSVVSSPVNGFSSRFSSRFADGEQTDWSGVDALSNFVRQYYSSEGSGQVEGEAVTLTVTYDREVEVDRVRFIEGDHFDDGFVEGGWFTSAFVEVRIGGVWVEPAGVVQSEAFDAGVPFQIVDFVLGSPVMADGIRITGAVGGADAFVTCGELDAMAVEADPGPRGFDVDGSGRFDIEDAYAISGSPIDLDGDGDADVDDRRILIEALRWREGDEVLDR